MATTYDITVKKQAIFKDPKWSVAEAKPGDEVELQVTAQDLLPGQTVHFEVRNEARELLAVFKADEALKTASAQKRKWTVPNVLRTGDSKYHFNALLREKPTVANGHLTVVERLKSF